MTGLRHRVGLRIALVAACAFAAIVASAGVAAAGSHSHGRAHSLWKLYDHTLREAKYIDLTHTITPSIPVWAGFGDSTFMPASDPATGVPYTYAASGFEATSYLLQTDQLGTQLDPPAHWAPEYAAIDELPPTFAVRPLVVISIVPQVKKDFNYHLQVSDILRWEKRHGRCTFSGRSSSTAMSRSTPTRRPRSKASSGSCTTASPRPRASRTSTRCGRRGA